MNVDEIKELFYKSKSMHFNLSYIGCDVFKNSRLSVLQYNYVWSDQISDIDKLITWGFAFCIDIDRYTFYYNNGKIIRRYFHDDHEKMKFKKECLCNSENDDFYKAFILIRDHI